MNDGPLTAELKNSLSLINLDLAPLTRQCAHLPLSNSILKAHSKPQLIESLELVENPLLNDEEEILSKLVKKKNYNSNRYYNTG